MLVGRWGEKDSQVLKESWKMGGGELLKKEEKFNWSSQESTDRWMSSKETSTDAPQINEQDR